MMVDFCRSAKIFRNFSFLIPHSSLIYGVNYYGTNKKAQGNA